MDVERRADVELIENCCFMFHMSCQHRAIEAHIRFHFKEYKAKFFWTSKLPEFQEFA